MTKPETPNPKTESDSSKLQFALAIAVLLLISLGAERATAQTTSPAQSGLSRYQRATTNQNRAANKLAWRGPSTNGALAGATRQAGRKVLAEIGPNHRSWRTESEDSAGAATNRFAKARGASKPSVVAIASGMNFWDGQQWSPSVPEFTLIDDAFVANQVQHRKRLNADLNVVGAVTTMLRDGTTLRSTPVAIGLYDPNEGRFAVVSTITNSVGVLVDSNRVVYPEAFRGGVCGDVIFTLQQGSFEQDVVITGRLNPLDYGFPTNAQIQCITEFYDAPEPEKIRRPIYTEKKASERRRKVSPDLVDEILGFGELVIGTGKAYTPPSATHPNGMRTVVAKEFRTIPGEGRTFRTFLIETLNCVPIQKALNALPECVGGTRTAQQIRNSRARDGYAHIPKAGSESRLQAASPADRVNAELQTPQAKAKPRRASNQFANTTAPLTHPADTLSPSDGERDGVRGATSSALPSEQRLVYHRLGVVIDYIETIDEPISTAKVFQSDTTYFVAAPVYCNGPVTIEGGAVFKYPNSTGPGATTTYLRLNHSLTCKTSSYLPAIFTAGDDDTLGESVWSTWGNYDGSLVYWDQFGNPIPKYYANPAIIVANYLSLSHCRFAYANVAIRCDGYEYVEATVNHSQFFSCVQGISLNDYTGGSGSGLQVTINNSLLAYVSYLLDGYSEGSGSGASLYLTQCTIANATQLIGTGFYNAGVTANNSIFAAVGDWGYASGDYNGFYDNGPSGQSTFGGHPTSETEWPFAPIGYLDGNDQEWYFVANAQGGYYLRDGSLFTDAGTASIPLGLKNDLRRMTTVIPELFNYDVNSSQTLSPTPIGDADALDLGYHYPVVHYVVCGATVNNCTLNIDQGTVLAFATPYYSDNGVLIPRSDAVKSLFMTPRYEWGIRVNPGGRLNVNGVPTNRVVFARLEAVQETPVFTSWFGLRPLITFKGIETPSAPVTPFAEARVRYADFPTPSGYFPIHFGELLPDWTYSMVQSFELEGCHFQGGGRLFYECAGGWVRTFTLRNNIFERSMLDFENWEGAGSQEEILTAANNLFYYCSMWLQPAVSGESWLFTDNIFDHVTFDSPNGGVNHHNAYIGMNGARLLPPVQPLTDPELTSLTYQTGPLGRFYLPTSATLLIDKGSQLAKDMGLFHFTSFTSNSKEGNGQVNIGSHYLALLNGKASDANGDGVPDFLADRNGNGIEDSDEMPWSSENNGSLTILAPPNNSSVSGILKLRVNLEDLGTGASQYALVPKINGTLVYHSTFVTSPLESLAEVEIDTRQLPNREHTVSVTTLVHTHSAGPIGTSGQEYIVSPGIVVNVANDVSYPFWEDMSQVAFKVNVETPNVTQAYTVWFFGPDYPTSYSPFPINEYQGNSSGNISFTETLANLGYGDGSTDPSLYSISELAVQSTARINPVTRNDPTFPDVGGWVVTYSQDVADAKYEFNAGNWDVSHFLDPLNEFDARWMHDIQLGAWTGCGVLSGAQGSPLVAFPQPGGSSPQTWPIRLPDLAGFYDAKLVRNFIGRPDVRNFYALVHGTLEVESQWGKARALPLGILPNDVKHRYRFVFFDGCETAAQFGPFLMRIFGASAFETHLPQDPNHRTLGFLADLGFPGNTGPTPMSLYFDYLRPSAFLGWNVKWPIALDLTAYYNKPKPQADPWTGLQCQDYQIYAAIANWHRQVVFFWTQQNETIVEALRDATGSAYVPGTGTGDLQVFSHIYVGPDLLVGPDRPEYYFDGPRQNLTLYGHGGLKFNAWNHAGDGVPTSP